MCEPTTIAWITLAVSAASTAYGVTEQRKAAKEQEQIGRDAADAEAAALALQEEQIDDAATDKTFERQRQARRERATARTVSGESGIFGNLSDKILGNISFQEGMDVASIENNRKNAVEQNGAEVRSSRVRHADFMSNIDQPNYADAGLQIAGAGLDTYSAYKGGKRKGATIM